MKLSLNKKVKLYFIYLLSAAFFYSCGGDTDNRTIRQEQPGKEEQSMDQAIENETEEITEAVADPMEIKGVGPVENVELGPVDQSLAEEGKTIYEELCTACHKIDERYIGPPVKEVTTRRSPEWIMNMILNPEVMVKEDPIAKALMAEYLSPMSNQNLTRDQARKILEYFRSISEVEQ